MGREPLTILIAEHDLDHANSVVDALQDEGHEMHLATSGAHALEIARRARIDCVLLDPRLADLDTIDVAVQLRAGILPATSIIILTNALGVSLAKAKSVDIDLILDKPHDASDLLSGLIRQVQSVRRRNVRRDR